MSLVNLAHVCSHLQNASKARLGVTSIPVSKLHARLMLELQKQGFLHSVVLGGPSPPLPYKLRPAPAFSIEETESDYIQKNPWAAFPQPNLQTLKRLNMLGFASSSGRESSSASKQQESKPGVITELRQEFKEDVPEDYWEEELEEDEDVVEHAAHTEAAPEPSTPPSIAEALSQIRTQQSALLRPQPKPLAPVPKVKRARYNINHHVGEDDRVPTNPAQRRLWLGLKYWDAQPVLSNMRLVSKPTKRIWLNHKDLSLVVRGQTTKQVKGIQVPGECIFVTTDRGIMEARECVEKRIGGTVLCRVS